MLVDCARETTAADTANDDAKVFITIYARVVNIWNSLPNVVVLASSLDTFKNRRDRFWGNQHVKYDYTAIDWSRKQI